MTDYEQLIYGVNVRVHNFRINRKKMEMGNMSMNDCCSRRLVGSLFVKSTEGIRIDRFNEHLIDFGVY